MPGYVIVGVEWHDAEALEAYRRDVYRTVEAFGGRFIIGTDEVDVRDSVEATRAWYESEEYGPVREIRKRGATTDLILVGGLE